jgi:hypothetical protein
MGYKPTKQGTVYFIWTHLRICKDFSLKGQSHEKVDELRVWGVSLGPN